MHVGGGGYGKGEHWGGVQLRLRIYYFNTDR